MRALVQRVAKGSVTIKSKVIGKICHGFVILLGVGKEDREKDAKLLAEKVAFLRVMADEEGKMNRSLLDAGGEALVVSQFTLYADTSRGRRPSFIKAARPEISKLLYELFIEELKQLGVKKVASGKFGAYMNVKIYNDGPVTILLDTDIV